MLLSKLGHADNHIDDNGISYNNNNNNNNIRNKNRNQDALFLSLFVLSFPSYPFVYNATPSTRHARTQKHGYPHSHFSSRQMPMYQFSRLLYFTTRTLLVNTLPHSFIRDNAPPLVTSHPLFAEIGTRSIDDHDNMETIFRFSLHTFPFLELLSISYIFQNL